ncbi:MAG: hypothetical protein GWM98_04900 [Nitrospinaceae bacterium]|nr:hypothetical protein [Nitrospinaceae bacterium]
MAQYSGPYNLIDFEEKGLDRTFALAVWEDPEDLPSVKDIRAVVVKEEGKPDRFEARIPASFLFPRDPLFQAVFDSLRSAQIAGEIVLKEGYQKGPASYWKLIARAYLQEEKENKHGGTEKTRDRRAEGPDRTAVEGEQIPGRASSEDREHTERTRTKDRDPGGGNVGP